MNDNATLVTKCLSEPYHNPYFSGFAYARKWKEIEGNVSCVSMLTLGVGSFGPVRLVSLVHFKRDSAFLTLLRNTIKITRAHEHYLEF